MGIGAAVRRGFGPLEPLVSELYRSRFINLDDLVRTVASVAAPTQVVEIGCGEGAVADRLCREFADLRYIGVDIVAEPGRLFAGDRSRAEFRSMGSSALLEQYPEEFDLVMLVDVFHHLPASLRLGTLRDLNNLCRPGGLIIVKDWARSRTVGHLACYVSDRYITGDENVRYATRSELWQTIEAGIPGAELVCEARIPPRRNNIMFAVRKPA